MKKLLVICMLACISTACEDEVISRIPLAPVDLTLDLNFEDRVLNGGYSFKTFIRNKDERRATDRLGYGGIVVFNKGFEMLAYDLSCPVEVQSDIRVKPNDTGQAICPKCGAVYNMDSNGSPSSGSEYYLRQYRVTAYGNGYRVTN